MKVTVNSELDLIRAEQQLRSHQDQLAIYKAKVFNDANRASYGKAIDYTQEAIREFSEAIGKYQISKLTKQPA